MPRFHDNALSAHIGAKIRALRIQRRLSQVEAADILGVSWQQFQKFEHGRNRISAIALIHLAEGLRAPLRYFIGDGDAEPEMPDLNAKPPPYVASGFTEAVLGGRVELAAPPSVSPELGGKPCSRCGGPRDRRGQRYCRACHAAYVRGNRKAYRDLSEEQRWKAKARAKARIYQKRGLIEVEPCHICGEPSAERHHPDYSKALEVVWLCRSCHLALHYTEEKGRLTTFHDKRRSNLSQNSSGETGEAL